MNDKKLMKIIRIRYGLSTLMMIFLILGIFRVKCAIPIALILLGIICIVTSSVVFKSNNRKSAITSVICGLIVIICGIKSLF